MKRAAAASAEKEGRVALVVEVRSDRSDDEVGRIELAAEYGCHLVEQTDTECLELGISIVEEGDAHRRMIPRLASGSEWDSNHRGLNARWLCFGSHAWDSNPRADDESDDRETLVAGSS